MILGKPGSSRKARRARATIAFFIPQRLTCIAQALSHDHFFERSIL
jgi:hypothetical protein